MRSNRKSRRYQAKILARISAKKPTAHSVNAKWRWRLSVVIIVGALTTIAWARTITPVASSPIPPLFIHNPSFMVSPVQDDHNFDFNMISPQSSNFVTMPASYAPTAAPTPRSLTAGKVISQIKMTYDSFNRMTSWSDGKHTERYEYHAMGWQRIKTITETRHADGTLTTQTLKHLYDRDNVIADFNEQNQMVAFYVTPDLDQPLAVTFFEYDPDGKRSNQTTYYYHYDGLGSVRALTDENGKTVADYDYTAFGESNDKLSSVLRRQQDAEKNRYTYTAREQSALAEYGAPMNYRNRSYQPSLGRFNQRDPIGYGDGANVYGYVHNRPNNNFDAYGLASSGFVGPPEQDFSTGNELYDPNKNYYGAGESADNALLKFVGNNFQIPAYNHDNCYAKCYPSYNLSNQKQCDETFKKEMNKICETKYKGLKNVAQRNMCHANAKFAYTAVSVQPIAFTASQKDALREDGCPCYQQFSTPDAVDKRRGCKCKY